jgi:predicted MarR family transcription regulator
MKESTNAWHLAETPTEMEITEFELTLWRVFHGFLRWQEDCERSANNNELSGQELSVLHVIRMKERPKSVIDVSRILNREDVFNLNYSIKKLLKMGLIEKTKGTVKKGATYQITDFGIQNIDSYVKARKQLLIHLFEKETALNLPEIIKGLTKIKGIYDEGSKLAASYRASDT